MPPKNRADIEGRRERVAALLLERKSLRQIARAVGVSVATAAKDASFVREEWRERRFTNTDTWMAEELARLDRAMQAIWPDVLKGKTFSIDRMLGIMDRRAKYLGLDTQPDAVSTTNAIRVTILDGRSIGPAGDHSLAALRSRVETLRAG